MADMLSSKRTLIDKANTAVVIAVSVAVFLFVFSAFATRTLVSQANYQNRVITEKRKARDQLKSDKKAVKDLKKAYKAFTNTELNVLGGDPNGVGAKDGNNAKIVLDALPSQYDFPALVTSLEALVANENVKIKSISGTDEEIAQAENDTSTDPEPIAIPFELSVSSNYETIQGVVSAFEKSIRPIQFTSLELSGGKDELVLTLGAQTYFQPAKSLNISTKVVK
ncbi:hypothetical protein CSA80_04325 [Candidatus Saccharibacteria bacterium]|nr:MAG: hypothetical protein CR973_01600 [Candidatus Saccharibacteria bacterium]PID98896.1 MAG: hypothetical protein CSA80_04325 [Candidatus Saccharibacteria bacterium]